MNFSKKIAEANKKSAAPKKAGKTNKPKARKKGKKGY